MPSLAIPRELVVPSEVVQIAEQSVGAFFESISRIDRRSAAADFLDYSKSFKRARILARYADLEGRKLLEIGSGFGANLAVWINHFHVDGYGVEPGGEGFNQGFIASRKLLGANGIDPLRVVDSAGESLPFADESFDIVYSANVLEHTADPERVLAEAFRVLRSGGLLHMEMPNYLSYFEGHYMVIQPPIFWEPLLPWWVKLVFGRDPAFARTLRTRINPIWCRRTLKKLASRFPLETVSLGEDLFLERLSRTFEFETNCVAGRIDGLVALLQKLNRGNWIGRVIVSAQGHYPIYLTVRKKRPAQKPEPILGSESCHEKH